MIEEEGRGGGEGGGWRWRRRRMTCFKKELTDQKTKLLTCY